MTSTFLYAVRACLSLTRARTPIMSIAARTAHASCTHRSLAFTRADASSARRAITSRASKVDKESMSFMERLRYEVDLTFNPRTAGAKIAGRCPDTQTRPSEADPAADAALNATSEGFDIMSFTEALERQMLEGDLDSRRASLEALRDAVAEREENEDEALECVVPDEDEEDEYGKYGKYHDMAIKHVKMGSGMRRWVSLNLYVGHLGQRSYPATEQTYLEQLDAIAYMITSWGQQQYTRAFFKEKKIARRGLPSTPRVDTCVTLQFSRSPTWDDELGDEYFDF